LDVMEEAYTTEHWIVRIYKVKDLPNRGVRWSAWKFFANIFVFESQRIFYSALSVPACVCVCLKLTYNLRKKKEKENHET
jgi:hypothetical protein